jgi:hypothetical protein
LGWPTVERLVSDETIARLPELDVEELTKAVEVLAHEGVAVRPGGVATFAAIAPGLPDLHPSLHGKVGQGGPLARAGMPD